MKEKTLEEQANELLLNDCRSHHKSMRQMGMVDARYQRLINSRELTVSDVLSADGIVNYEKTKRKGAEEED